MQTVLLIQSARHWHLSACLVLLFLPVAVWPGEVAASPSDVEPRGATYRVGVACEYSKIQDAIDAIGHGGTGTIRVRTGTFQENIQILSRSVSIIGGHADCVTTTPTPGERSQVSGTLNADPVVRVFSGSTGSPHVHLYNMRLVNGQANDFYEGGGLAARTNGAELTILLDNVRVDHNSGRRGGGVFFGVDPGTAGTGTLFIFNDTRIHDNLARDPAGGVLGLSPGGGLYCRGNLQVLMLGGRIFNNTAGSSDLHNGRGGGIHIDAGCTMNWYSQNVASGPATLDGNVSWGFGGGAMAANGGELNFRGREWVLFGNSVSRRPLRIYNNSALGIGGSGYGGGVTAFNGGVIRIHDSHVDRNEAEYRGGGLHATGNGSLVEMRRTGPDCHSSRHCSMLLLNEDLVGGAAGYATFEGRIDIARTIVGENYGSSIDSGSTFGLHAGGRLDLNHSVVYGLSRRYTFSTSGDAEYDDTALNIRFSTIANTVLPDGRIFRLGSGGVHMQLWDSIVHSWESNTMASLFAGATYDIDCVLWHEAGPFTDAVRTEVGYAEFSHPLNGEFYLKSGSPAINFCPFSDMPNVDLEWRQRGLSHSGKPNLHGPYDLGAYERPDQIFSDRLQF